VNLLIDALPHSVEIGGREYPIHADFKTCLRVILACEDGELTSHEKQIVLLANLYPTLPPDAQAAIERANWLLNGGEEGGTGTSGPRVFSFAKDAKFIFAAFRSTHNIDLTAADLHWWQFLSLFMDLGSKTTFCQLVNLRKRVKTGKATKEERAAAREMADLFDLPDVDDRTLEEREVTENFFKLVEEGKRKRQEVNNGTPD
jgi:hypothetical protein